MRVHFDNVNLTGSARRTGPNTFALRLIVGLLNRGIEVVDRGPDADVSIVFIQPTGQKLARKVIQRLDGIWFKPDNFQENNAAILNCYNAADAVVLQSRFDLSMVTRWFGAHRSTVIHNGINFNKETLNVSHETLSSISALKRSYSRIFVCSANWHPQKRLVKNLELYYSVKNGLKDESCCMLVMGNRPDVIHTTRDVFYAGSLDHDDCLYVYANADWMYHLAWADHCPNVVVEAIACGLPVVCSDVGGTSELVGSFGLVVHDQDYSFELFDYDNPPNIDVKQIARLPSRDSLGPPGVDVSMDRVIDDYVAVIQSVI